MSETSNLILSEFADLGFATIWNCFNLIKLGKKPFDKDNTLFEALDGAKVLERLTRYRGYLIELRENKHNDIKSSSELDFKILANASAKAPDLAAAFFSKFTDMTDKKLHDKVASDIEKDKTKQAAREAEAQAIIDQWTSDYEAMEKPIGTLEEYLTFQAECLEEARLLEQKKIVNSLKTKSNKHA